MVCSQKIAFESWILPLNLGVELHVEIQAQPFSTKHLLKKKSLIGMFSNRNDNSFQRKNRIKPCLQVA